MVYPNDVIFLCDFAALRETAFDFQASIKIISRPFTSFSQAAKSQRESTQKSFKSLGGKPKILSGPAFCLPLRTLRKAAYIRIFVISSRDAYFWSCISWTRYCRYVLPDYGFFFLSVLAALRETAFDFQASIKIISRPFTSFSQAAKSQRESTQKSCKSLGGKPKILSGPAFCLPLRTLRKAAYIRIFVISSRDAYFWSCISWTRNCRYVFPDVGFFFLSGFAALRETAFDFQASIKIISRPFTSFSQAAKSQRESTQKSCKSLGGKPQILSGPAFCLPLRTLRKAAYIRIFVISSRDAYFWSCISWTRNCRYVFPDVGFFFLSGFAALRETAFDFQASIKIISRPFTSFSQAATKSITDCCLLAS